MSGRVVSLPFDVDCEVPWVPSSRSAASAWRRRSTASCCARRATSAATAS